ncbi:MAG: MAPEG family protein [Parvibaculaceae bacterium]
MTVELSAIVYAGALLLLLILISAATNVSAMGQAWGTGNREAQPSAEGLKGRAKRAYMNLLEQLVVFSALAIPAHIAGIHSSMTILAAQLFIVGRVLHAIVYLAGWTFISIRTLVWVVALVGTFIMAYEVLTSGLLILQAVTVAGPAAM